MSAIILLLPFVALITLNVLPRTARGASWGITLGIFALQTVLAALQPLGLIDWSFLAPLPSLLSFTLSLDALSLLLIASAGIAGMTALLVGRATLSHPRTRFIFTNLLLVALIGMNGIAMVSDLFTLWVFIEVTSVAAFILVTVRDGKPALEGAWKYLLLSSIASVFMLASLGFFLLSAGGVSFAEAAASLASPTPFTWVAVALFLCGLFV
ncbi:MAG: hypothetical protein ABSG63_11570, partial [Spirochaetia bacterium]